MQVTQSGVSRPSWLSPELFPFDSRYFTTPAGALHYVDEGAGRPLVFVHGNPSWSFEFRHLIAALRSDFRCVAVDHIGFGLSDKSRSQEELDPRRHALRLRALLDHLALDDVTLVMGDWGGPIGLDFAVAHPARVSNLVLFNTWAWPVNGDLHYEMFSRMMGSPVGQFWIRCFNVFVNVVLPMSVGDKSVLTPEVMRHYQGPFERVEDRLGQAILPQHILAARSWLGDIWRRRGAFADKPALIVWGGSDIAFRDKELAVWREALGDATVHLHETVGHLVAEEIPDRVVAHMQAFLADAPVAAAT